MIGAVDIGGTKTLVAVFDDQGKIIEQKRFETAQNYNDFLGNLQETVAKLSTKDFKIVVVAAPATLLDRQNGIGVQFGNLAWEKVPLEVDAEQIFQCPIIVENDAKVAGLSEAKYIIKDFKKVLYITIGTGIGVSLIVDGIIDKNIGDAGGRTMLVEYKGNLVLWESFASGKAILHRFGKLAKDLKDPKIWETWARDFAIGIVELIAVTQPDVIVIGGGVGSHFAKFEKALKQQLTSYQTPLMPIPPLLQARHPEEAVIYGCYDLAKDQHAKAR